MEFLDLTGKRFGYLTVMWPDGRKKMPKSSRVYWACCCDCGNIHHASTGCLRDGFVKSCGCLQKRLQARLHNKHGKHLSAEYCAYTSAKQRCTNPNNPGYKNYGGRGIEFRFKSFEEFYAEVGPRPSPELTLDRINNDGHYEPGNLRWATWSQNLNNQRGRV